MGGRKGYKELKKYQHKNQLVDKKSKEFTKLQNEWYAKLKDEGFNDLEYTCKTSGAVDIGMFKGGENEAYVKKQYRLQSSQTLHFYNLLSNFLTHNQSYGILDIDNGEASDIRNRYICQAYVEGKSYRQIIKLWNKTYYLSKGFSTIVVFAVVNKFIKEAKAWNKESPEGLEYKDLLDAAEDAVGGEA